MSRSQDAMKYRILFADLTHTGMGINADVFPLGVSMVAAYTLQELPGMIEVEIHKFPEDLNRSLLRKMPHVLCMSHYMWNTKLSYAFAEFVKRAFPKTLIIFGGPELPLAREERKDFLGEKPAIDFYIKWDGEHAFVNLLKELIARDLDQTLFKGSRTVLGNVCYMTPEGDYVEGPDERIEDLMTVPSPYTLGLLDPFFSTTLMPIFETTRGCPYSCTFCNDGSSTRNRVFRKTPEYIREELNYIAEKRPKSAQLCFADLNFGMYQHDVETAKIIQEIRKKYHWPDRMQGSMGKSQPQRLVQVANIINEGDLGIIKLGSSLQSTDPEVLKAIRRTNLSMDQLLAMRAEKEEATQSNLQDYTELIVPLPGQTVAKHYQTLREVIDRLGMNNIDVHQLTMLNGSQMAIRTERERLKLEIRHRILVGCLGNYEIGEKTVPIVELEETVIATRSMTFEEYLECRIMTLLVKIFVDNDPFKEVFGLIRYLRLSPFDVLLHLKNRHLQHYPVLLDLMQRFVDSTKIKLFEDRKVLEEMASRLGSIEEFISGPYGQNELLIYRVLAYRDYYADLSSALKDAVVSYLNENRCLSEDVRDYVEDASQFCSLRRFDLQNLETPKEGTFRFDFIKAETHGFQVDPQEVKKTVKLRFYYDEEDIEVIRKQIRRWGTETLHQLGKFVQKTNSLRTRRKVLAIA